MELSAVISQAIADVDVFAERAASMVRYSAYCAEIEAQRAAARAAMTALFQSRRADFEKAGMELSASGCAIAGMVEEETILRHLDSELFQIQREASLAAAEREKAEKVRRGELPAVEIDGRPFYLQGLTLAVPAGAFRHVIGRGGENIKRMSANAGGRIRLIELQTSDYFKFKKFAYGKGVAEVGDC